MDEKKVREAIYCMKASIGETMCEECVNYYKCDHTKMDDMMRTAIEALEKQLPKKLIEHHYEEPGETPYIKYGCGNGCKMQPSRSSKYCNQCGQRIDWSEDRRVEE